MVKASAKGRRGSRKLALDILFEHEIAGSDVEAVLRRHASNPAYDFAAALVRGVRENLEKIDEALSAHCGDWPVDRMPAIDRSLLRLAVFEILFPAEASPAVAINEAVELAQIYSGESSSRFINGVLGQIAPKNT